MQILNTRKKKNTEKKRSIDKEDRNNENDSRTNQLETRHLKLHQETLEDREFEYKLKEEKQT